MIVRIPSDPASLGPEATTEDVERYRAALARHLDCDVQVASVARSEAEDPYVEAYVRDLEAGGGWLALVQAVGA